MGGQFISDVDSHLLTNELRLPTILPRYIGVKVNLEPSLSSRFMPKKDAWSF